MTHPELSAWPLGNGGYRRSEVSALIGSGDAVWERATAELLRWKVKTASGFEVDPGIPMRPGQQLDVRVRLPGMTIVEPVEVLAVVGEPDRVGFSYGTLPGHPVDGEEAFILERRGDEVHLIVRSLTRPSPRQPWRALFPMLLLIQLVVRRRYLRALRP